MREKVLIVVAIAAVLLLPFLLRHKQSAGAWSKGDPILTIITPHNEAIREEFGNAFSQWHQRHYEKPVKVEWRVIGGTTEIMRYLESEFSAGAKQHFKELGKGWPAVGAQMLFSANVPEEAAHAELWHLYREVDAPSAITARIDLFFGGGVYDHSKAESEGFTVPAWPLGEEPEGLFSDSNGRTLIPHEINGEVWCGRAYYGNVLSTFGICYNFDRLVDLGIPEAPKRWQDLADPRYLGSVGLSDPTKSGSVAKAFEMIIHESCALSVARAGFTREEITAYELLLKKGVDEAVASGAVPRRYQEAVEQGWLEGVRLVQRIAANARYFTDASGKVPADVGMGAAAAGIVIDFYGRLQAEMTTRPGSKPVMAYVTPVGGSCVSADPISVLRGAPNRKTAERFIEFLLGEEGQRLWNYRPGVPGGPQRFALRRLPVKRDFYPSEVTQWQERCAQRRELLSDPLWEPETDVYHLANSFHYMPRWTGNHFGIQRDLIRAMCMDSGEELRLAWRTILKHGGPERNPVAMQALTALPQHPWPLDWSSAVKEYQALPRLELLSSWTEFFRTQYRKAAAVAGGQ